MTSCELCGTEGDELDKVKISGAELMVCEDCADLGTKVGSEDNNSNQDTKYSTSSSSNSSSSNSNNKSNKSNKPTKTSSSKNNNYNPEPSLDDVNDLALNYGDMITDARVENGMSREDLAKKLGIKESHLQKVENERTQPSIDLQNKIEKALDIDLGIDDELN